MPASDRSHPGPNAAAPVADGIGSRMRAQDQVRWAGDEFVILFDGAAADEARQICGRTRAAVAGFDGLSVAAELGVSVGVSVGVAEVAPGDRLAAVLQRSDESMYRQKARARG